jgi:elongation factor Ts
MMAAITASMVAELRGKTDAPMMECKKALTEAEGDAVRAEEILRVKLGSKAGKAAARITAEGVITASINGTVGALVEVNCETDFVTKNDSFLAFAKAVAGLAAEHNPADVAALSALPLSLDGFGPAVEDVRKGLIGKIGENMAVRRFKRYADGGQLAPKSNTEEVCQSPTLHEPCLGNLWAELSSVPNRGGALIETPPQSFGNLRMKRISARA